MKPHLLSLFSPRGLVATLALVGALVVAPDAARAHIKMSAPVDWITTNSSGDPQKITPCGVDPTMPSTFTVTGVVTTLHVGDKVTFNWTETVPHDGHFRIALAINSRDELTDPAVTKKNSDGTAAEVEISTAYPVLADNLFPHTAASVSANKAYTYSVIIPNTPCTKCTLQLLQFMANHPLDPSYFYHQCADVMILAASGNGGSSGGGGKAGSPGGTGGNGGRTGGTGGTGGTASGGSGGRAGGTGGATSGTGGAITGAGGATSGTGGATVGTGGATSGTGGSGGSTSGTGGAVATGSGGSAMGSGGDGATGSGGAGTGGTVEGGGSSGGCACQLGAANANLIGIGILGVALICLGRRRRAR